jgi:GWxTD domain-containing protein
VLRPLEVYKQLGMLAGSEEFPAVASFATLAGPHDSTYVVFALSLPNSALSFQRDGDAGFVGRYHVSLAFSQGGKVVRQVQGREEVRVPTFSETGRTDESVVYQTVVALAPGRYAVAVEAGDAAVRKGVKTQDSLDVPVYRQAGARLAGPFFVYRAQGRSSTGVTPDLIINPRHTIPYGGESPRIYLEGYGLPADQSVRLRILGEDQKELWHTDAVLAGNGGELAHTVVEVPSASLPLGRLWAEASLAGEGSVVRRAPMVVTISDQWMVANFEETLDFLRYIATKEELDSLENAGPVQRAALWERFWARRDPIPATPINEFREQFFERIRAATLYFPEPGRAGWKTDRGEVFIVLGPPDQVFDRYIGIRELGRPNAYDWVYERGPEGRIVLTFYDRNRTDRFELTPASRVTFRSAANRLKPRS